MARYKVLKSVAHSFGHSFVSTLTYAHGDYAMGHLLRTARELNEGRVALDILTGEIRPSAFAATRGGTVLSKYARWFPGLVLKHDTQMDCIATARMEIAFDLSQAVPFAAPADVAVAPSDPGSPYDLDVAIVDDRGTEWSAHLHGWEYPLQSARRV